MSEFFSTTFWVLLGFCAVFAGIEYLILQYQERNAEKFAGGNCEKFLLGKFFSKKKYSLGMFFAYIAAGSAMYGVSYLFSDAQQDFRDFQPPVFVVIMSVLSVNFGWKMHAIWFGENGVKGGGLPKLRWEEIEKISFDMDKGQTGWYYNIYLKNRKKPIRAMVLRDKKAALEEKFSFYLEKFSSGKENVLMH